MPLNIILFRNYHLIASYLEYRIDKTRLNIDTMDIATVVSVKTVEKHILGISY